MQEDKVVKNAEDKERKDVVVNGEKSKDEKLEKGELVDEGANSVTGN